MKKIVLIGVLINLLAVGAFAQSSEFTYQGRLLDNSAPASAIYDFQFSLWDSLANGTQQGTTQTVTSVAVVNGIFTVRLNFGAQFTGAARFLQIEVRTAGGGSYTTLVPRQAITSGPYAIRSLNSTTADTATTSTTANNALSLGGIAANQYVVTTDPRMTDSRDPLPNSTNYIQNRSSGTQSSSNFSVSGTGSANILNAGTQFNLGGSRVLSSDGSNNLFVGVSTGFFNSIGGNNSFFGTGAGFSNTRGNHNSFFGSSAGSANDGDVNAFFGSGSGRLNTTGSENAFFGGFAGSANTTGLSNSFFGRSAGQSNSAGNLNAFFGANAGFSNTTGTQNSFFGTGAGNSNTSGSNNAYFGVNAGIANLTGVNNTIIGSFANVGSDNLTFATAIGANSVVSASNTIALGRSGGQDSVVIPGALSVTGAINGTVTNATNSVTANNALNLGGVAAGQYVVTTDPRMSDARNPLPNSANYIQNTSSQQSTSNFNISGNGTVGGTLSGNVVSAGTQYNIGNDRVLSASGVYNDGVNNFPVVNTFVGEGAGINTTPNPSPGNVNGKRNSFFGAGAGKANTGAIDNSFFGFQAGFATMTGEENSFFGSGAGLRNTGSNNSFFGSETGNGTTAGSNNTFFGFGAGGANSTGSRNTVIGASAAVGSDSLINATAIGSQALVSQNNSLILGSINGVNFANADTNVGIGTTAPDARLSVSANSTNAGNNTAQFAAPNIGANASHIHYGPTGDWYIRSAADSGNVILQDTGGKVGIGTASPNSKLDVSGAEATVEARINASNFPALVLSINNQSKWRLGSNSGNSGLEIRNLTTGGNPIFITSTDNVGIGDNSAVDKLSVNGTFRFSTLGAAGSVSLCRNIFGQISSCSSSRRYKQDISDFSRGLDLVKRLRPVSFNWKQTHDADVGLIAEEVANIEPLLITRNDKGEVEGVKYDRVGVIAVNAIKEQQAQIEVQQRELVKQKAINQRLQTQIDALKKLICAHNRSAEVCKEELK